MLLLHLLVWSLAQEQLQITWLILSKANERPGMQDEWEWALWSQQFLPLEGLGSSPSL